MSYQQQKPKFSPELIRTAVENCGGIRAAARQLGISDWTVRKHMGRGTAAGKSVRLPPEAPEPQATGQVHYRRPEILPLPPEGQIATYIVTAAQLSTEVHADFWRNLLALGKVSRKLGPTKLLVARMTYDQRAYRRPDQVKSRSKLEKEVKRGEAKAGEYWIADEVAPYLSDARVQLAPGLQWCGELNILPTAVRPLNGLSGYTGRDSAIVPHTKLALESVPTGRHEPTKFLFSTGAVTLRNYVQKRAGQLAEFHHAYAALIVEVASDGRWWVRQLNATSDGAFQDLTRRVAGGRVTFDHAVSAIQWGDVHASAIDRDVRALCWGPLPKGQTPLIDSLRPLHQFCHDLDDSNADSHHDRKSARKRFEAWLRGNRVQDEVMQAAGFLKRAHREWCTTIVVPSNHDEHRDRWLDEADPRQDPHNSELWHRANAAMRQALLRRERWSFAQWAYGSLAKVLDRDESFVLHEIEMGWHGDLGPNGARGSTQALVRTCRRICKGHDHTATIRDGVYSAGVCARTLDYARGPSAWSISHIVVYPNGKRAILTQNGDAYWAPRVKKSRSKK
jgi:hypothetical protein